MRFDETAKLSGAELDAAVARIEGWKQSSADPKMFVRDGRLICIADGHDSQIGWSPSTDWAAGGPIIEREGIAITMVTDATWSAECLVTGEDAFGPTPLIAAMRAFVAAKGQHD